METATFELLTKPLIAMGLPGLIIIALSYGLYRLANAYHSVQEARISETKGMVQAMGDMTSALNSLSDLIKDRSKG